MLFPVVVGGCKFRSDRSSLQVGCLRSGYCPPALRPSINPKGADPKRIRIQQNLPPSVVYRLVGEFKKCIRKDLPKIFEFPPEESMNLINPKYFPAMQKKYDDPDVCDKVVKT